MTGADSSALTEELANAPTNLDNVSAMIACNSRRRPHRLALVQGTERVTYRQLEERVAHAAGALACSGVRSEAIAGLSMTDSADHLVILLALMRVGAIVLPMEPRWTDPERNRLISTFRPEVIVTDNSNLSVGGIRTIVAGGRWMDQSLQTKPMSTWTTTPSSPLLLSLSSGTTGSPKGPLMTHGLALRRLVHECLSMGFTWEDVNLCAAPLYFGGGRNVTLSNLFVGATVYIFPPPYEAEELAKEIIAHRITNMFLVPTTIRRLLKLSIENPPLFPDLRMLQSGGGILHEDELKLACQLLTPGVINVFATTEAGVVTVPTPDESNSHPASVGRAGVMSEVQIVDAEHRPVKPGVIGRVRYWTPATPPEYYQNEEETALAFRDGWFYPGDMGWLDEDGYLYLSGRSKDMIIRGGINIFPIEIEGVLQAHPDIMEAAVVGWPIGDLGEEVAAFVTVTTAKEQDLLAYCREHLVRYKVPRRVFVLQRLPKNLAGKIMKADLVKMLPSELGGPLSLVGKGAANQQERGNVQEHP
jgi:acyl-CoA synthetase (AMP-forming)/AMP-acid ligase II